MKAITIKPNQQLTIIDLGDTIKIVDQDKTIPAPQHIHLGENSVLNYYINWQKTSQDRKIVIHLNAPGADAKITGIFFTNQKHRISLNSTMIHHAPNTYGNTYVKGALQDEAKADLSGMIKINKGAHGSNDLLTEKILLLSPKTRAQAEPMLEIDADEVKATHAATISRLNQDHLYYLQTRGLNQIQAEKLIVDGFLQEILKLLPPKLQKLN